MKEDGVSALKGAANTDETSVAAAAASSLRASNAEHLVPTFVQNPPYSVVDFSPQSYGADATAVVQHKVVIWQSLADLHPDVDAIHRLTKIPTTFSFPTSSRGAIPRGLVGEKGSYAPCNAQAALFDTEAFWSLLLPITVTGRVSDIWRAYFSQRLMSPRGLLVAFSLPWVDQERSPHSFLADFEAESQLYSRSGAFLDLLEAWRPSSPLPSLGEEMEDLAIALYEYGILGEADARLMQAWILDLEEAGYSFGM